MKGAQGWWVLWAGTLSVFLMAHLDATVIVGVKLRGQIILAADSSTIDEMGTLLDDKVCKLVAGERHVFGLAGTTISESFNAFHLAATAARGARTVVDANQRFVKSVEPSLRALVLTSMRDPEPIWSTIASPCRDDRRSTCGNLLQYVIAGDDNGTLRVSIFALNFRAPSSPTLTLDQIKVTSQLEGPDPEPAGFAPGYSETPRRRGQGDIVPFAVGTFDAIASDLRPVLFSVQDTMDGQVALERLISTQLKATPTRTAGPIDVIQITTSRPPVWLKQKPECR